MWRQQDCMTIPAAQWLVRRVVPRDPGTRDPPSRPCVRL